MNFVIHLILLLVTADFLVSLIFERFGVDQVTPLCFLDPSFIEAAAMMVTHIDSSIMQAFHLKQTRIVIEGLSGFLIEYSISIYFGWRVL
jgi:hypothetical protein